MEDNNMMVMMDDNILHGNCDEYQPKMLMTVSPLALIAHYGPDGLADTA